MKYSGEELYKIWKRKLAECGCVADDWVDIDEFNRHAWCLLAIELMNEE